MIDDSLLTPESVAIVGATNAGQKRGNSTIRFLKRAEFRGTIYPVNPKYQEVAGYRCYASLNEIPGSVDHVVCCLPAHDVPALAKECVAKGVKLLHIYTAGFSETRIPERIELEQQVVDIARRGGLRVLGPNCMGIYRPSAGLAFNTHSPKDAGGVSVISQSGGNASDLGRMAAVRGLRFNTVVSYGNAADINETELLQFLGRDPQTKVIGAFIEGVRDMDAFHQTLADVSRAKPVVILKGGTTDAGSRAVAAHTGAAGLARSMAGRMGADPRRAGHLHGRADGRASRLSVGRRLPPAEMSVLLESAAVTRFRRPMTWSMPG